MLTPSTSATQVVSSRSSTCASSPSVAVLSRMEYGHFGIYTGQRNRPVLLWADGSVITQKEAQAEDQLGFKVVELYSSTLKINARRVEDALQQRHQHLPLGTRLWRCNDKGSKFDQAKDAGKVHKVFLTFSPLVAKELRNRTIKRN